MQTKKTPALKGPQVNDSLPTLFIDGAVVRHRNDGVSFIRLTASLPDVNSEQARIMISDEDLRKIIDALCQSINYYPTKPSGGKRPLKMIK